MKSTEKMAVVEVSKEMACDDAQSVRRKQVPGRVEGGTEGRRDGGMESGMEGWSVKMEGGMEGGDVLDRRQQARPTQDPQEHIREESAHFMTMLAVLGSPAHAQLVSPAPCHSQGVS